MKKARTILIVEDQASISDVERMALTKAGYRVLVAHDGGTAIRMADEESEIDLILMDINLGEGVDGIDTAKVILQRHDLPLVFISADVSPETTQRMESVSSYGFVAKRAGVTTLDASIKLALRLFAATKEEEWAKRKLAATLDALPDQLLEVDLAGIIYDHHSPQPDLLYKSKARIIGKYLQDIHPEEASRLLLAAVSEADAKGSATGVQFEIDVPRGRRWFEISVARKGEGKNHSRFIILKRDITERKHAEIALKEALEQNQVLLGELQHRAKNSFNMISSMIAITADNAHNPEAKGALEDLDSRVRSVAELYSLLYSTGSFTTLRLDEYCARVAQAMVGLSNISLATDFEAIEIPVAGAAPIGLILTELITNAIKHAFDGREGGRIAISLRKDGKQVLLEVGDDGPGLSPDAKPSENPGMGLNLIRALAAQLGGGFDLLGSPKGTRGILKFPMNRG